MGLPGIGTRDTTLVLAAYTKSKKAADASRTKTPKRMETFLTMLIA